MQVSEVREPSEAAGFLLADTPRQIYALADLDEPLWADARAWVGRVDGAPRAVAILFQGAGLPVLHALGPLEPTAELVRGLLDVLPARMFGHLEPGLLDAVPELGGVDPELYAKLHRQGAPDVASPAAERLRPAQLAELEAFYAERAYGAGEAGYFAPYMLELGPYVGIREGGQLACAAGIHVISRRYRVAAIGNVATAPDARGRGLARAALAALCWELVAEGVETIGLNVSTHNAPALRCYRGLGFGDSAHYVEAVLERS